MFGSVTGKVLGYSVRSNRCRICESAQKRNVAAADHKCRKNWEGSVKAMEPDMVADMVTQEDYWNNYR